MFTSFIEKQERYSVPRPSLASTPPASTSIFDEVNKPVLPPDADVVNNNNEGYVMFVEEGESILPANATIPGPNPPPPTAYSFSLTYHASSCAQACYSSNTTVYYSLSSTLVASSKLYTDSALTTPVANGYYSEGSNSGNCYDITDSAGTINSVSACNITCWQYTAINNSKSTIEFQYIDCDSNTIILFIAPFSSSPYCINTYDPSTTGPCTL